VKSAVNYRLSTDRSDDRSDDQIIPVRKFAAAGGDDANRNPLVAEVQFAAHRK